MNLWMIAVVAAAVFAASAGFTRFLVGHLTRVGVIDRPNERSSHETPTPRGGGLAVATCSGLGILVLAIMAGQANGSVLLPLALAVAFATIGALDDLRDLSVRFRLAASVLVAGGFTAAVAPGYTGASLGIAILVGTVFVVGGANIYNFMDGIDGIAASTAIAAGMTMVAVGWVEGQLSYVIVGVGVAAAATGFLTENWSPATIFLGDVGSLFFGGIIMSLTLVATLEGPVSGMVLASPMLPFFVDGGLTLGRRWRRGDSVLRGHREHVYQRAAMRWGHSRVSASYATAAGAFGLAAAGLLLVSNVAAAMAVLAAAATSLIAWTFVDARLQKRQSP